MSTHTEQEAAPAMKHESMAEIILSHNIPGTDDDAYAAGIELDCCYICGVTDDPANGRPFGKPRPGGGDWLSQHQEDELRKAGYGRGDDVEPAMVAAAKTALLDAADKMPIETLAGADGAYLWLRAHAEGMNL